METRAKLNADFRMEMSEQVSKHEADLQQVNSNYEQLKMMVQSFVTEIQSIRMPSNSPQKLPEEVLPPVMFRAQTMN